MADCQLEKEDDAQSPLHFFVKCLFGVERSFLRSRGAFASIVTSLSSNYNNNLDKAPSHIEFSCQEEDDDDAAAAS